MTTAKTLIGTAMAAALRSACGGETETSTRARADTPLKAADKVATQAEFVDACTNYHAKAPLTTVNAYTGREMTTYMMEEIQAEGPRAFCECVAERIGPNMAQGMASVNRIATDVDVDEAAVTPHVVRRAFWDGVDGYPKRLAYERSPDTAERAPLMSLVSGSEGDCKTALYERLNP